MGKKRLRGCPIVQDEVKTRHNIMLTPTAWQLLIEESKKENTSVSEVVERMVRQTYNQS